MAVFLGVDLGWHGKPTGLAAAVLSGDRVRLTEVTRIEGTAEILEWIRSRAGEDCVCAVDGPLVIPNASGNRHCERELNAKYQRFHAGCYPAHQGRPFAAYLTSFSAALSESGFRHAPDMPARASGRWQIEVHPHAAAVSLFRLDRIVKYKKGRRDDRALELERLRELITTRLPLDNIGLIPEVPERGNLKTAEDQIDAVLCAYVAAHWWLHGRSNNDVFGSEQDGYIVVPRCDRNQRPRPMITSKVTDVMKNT